jgi:phosphate starvation-inducible protein PhoH
MQTDLPSNKAGGFEDLFNLFSDEDSKAMGIYTFTFDEEDIVRSKIVKFIVNKLKSSK